MYINHTKTLHMSLHIANSINTIRSRILQEQSSTISDQFRAISNLNLLKKPRVKRNIKEEKVPDQTVLNSKSKNKTVQSIDIYRQPETRSRKYSKALSFTQHAAQQSLTKTAPNRFKFIRDTSTSIKLNAIVNKSKNKTEIVDLISRNQRIIEMASKCITANRSKSKQISQANSKRCRQIRLQQFVDAKQNCQEWYKQQKRLIRNRNQSDRYHRLCRSNFSKVILRDIRISVI